MEKEDFREILERYLSGCATKTEIEIVEKWYASINNSDSSEIDPVAQDEAKQEERYLSAIKRHVEKDRDELKAPGRSRFLIPSNVRGLAAAILLLILVAYLLPNRVTVTTPQDQTQISTDVAWKDVVNDGHNAQKLDLPDGSSVILEPSSSIRFSTLFDMSSREVFLEGEAFFEVNPDPHKPFLVYANDVITKVLGTSFTVRSFRDDRQVKVVVKTGKVSVFANSDTTRAHSPEIILTPNQEMIYDRSEKLVQRRIVEEPHQIIKGQTEHLRFEEAPLKEIIDAIEQVYGVEIEYDEKKFAACVLTTSVTSGGLYRRMDIITTAIGATYELKDDRIVINGSGCDHHQQKSINQIKP